MKVALVHDWLTGMRGGERVLQQMCGLFPDATLFTLFHDPGSVSPEIEAMTIRTSFLNRIPGMRLHYRYFLPLYPWAVSGFDLRDFDMIISSSHAVAKGARIPHGSLHVCYCHTPMRYIWDAQDDYFHYGDPLGIRKTALRALTLPLRYWDRRTSRRVDYFIANSRHVQWRISRWYRRSACVIYPPVDTTFFTLPQNGHARGFFLVVSALVSAKRLDLAVDTFNRLGHPLVIVGSGPDLDLLKSRAARNIQFRGFVTDQELRQLYWQCHAVVVPGREDFGIVALEAQACGRPVVAFAEGGTVESVSDGETGILFHHQTVDDLARAVRRASEIRFSSQKLRENAERFSAIRFRNALQSALEHALASSVAGSRSRASQIRTTAAESLREPSAACNPQSTSAIQVSTLPHPSLAGVGGFLKRSLDIVIAGVGLALLGVFLWAVALLILLTSPGSALFFQNRVGLDGRIFRMVKLRTMRANAEKDNVPSWAVDRDPRCTPLGYILRRYGIDELPQLWNILKGEMSLVGPRPERLEFHRLFAEHDPRFERRLEVRGGLTGLAQIRGWRGNTSLEQRLLSDLEYIQTWSVAGDLRILIRTPIALLRGSQHPSVSPPAIRRC